MYLALARSRFWTFVALSVACMACSGNASAPQDESSAVVIAAVELQFEDPSPGGQSVWLANRGTSEQDISCWPGSVSDSFAGDAFYLPSSASASTIVFQWTTGGNFVIGDGNSGVGMTSTFWSAQWRSANVVSGGTAPSAFKGFAGSPDGPTTCGGTFSARPGNSTPPPESVPSFTPMLVTSSVEKVGNTITGSKPSIVVVQTNAGYGPAPGHTGTAQVIAVLCP